MILHLKKDLAAKQKEGNTGEADSLEGIHQNEVKTLETIENLASELGGNGSPSQTI